MSGRAAVGVRERWEGQRRRGRLAPQGPRSLRLLPPALGQRVLNEDGQRHARDERNPDGVVGSAVDAPAPHLGSVGGFEQRLLLVLEKGVGDGVVFDDGSPEGRPAEPSLRRTRLRRRDSRRRVEARVAGRRLLQR